MAFCVQNCAKNIVGQGFHTAAVIIRQWATPFVFCLSEGATVTKGGGAYLYILIDSCLVQSAVSNYSQTNGAVSNYTYLFRFVVVFSDLL